MIQRMSPPSAALPAYFLAASLGLFPGSGVAHSQEGPSSFTLTAKVRDFRELSPGDSDLAHPHFNYPIGCSAKELGVNTVAEEIGGGDADLAFPNDERDPALLDPLPATIADCYDPPGRFAEWFNDADTSINRAVLVDLDFVRDEASGLYRYSSDAFFPIDSGASFRKRNPADPDPFGHLQTDTVEGVALSNHNYGFTMELHATLPYVAGAGQVLRYQGDDDIWVFLNGKRVIDLGGVHQTQIDSVPLDSVRESLGLADGGIYPLDFFFAERHTASSSVLITVGGPAGTVPIHRPAPLARSRPGGPVFIYDRLGRLVRSLPSVSAWNGGGASPAWDRRDGTGRVAAPGVYFWRAAGSGTAGVLRAGTLVAH